MRRSKSGQPAKGGASTPRFSVFEVLRVYSEQRQSIEEYLSSYRRYDPQELILEWKEEPKDILAGQQLQVGPVEDVAGLEGRHSSLDGILKYLVKKEKLAHFRTLVFDGGVSFPERVLFSFFVSLVERKADSLEESNTLFTELYSLSHHFGLKTDYFLKFTNLSKYFQYVLYQLNLKKLPSPQLYKACVVDLISRSFNSKEVINSIKKLFLELAKVALQFISDNNLRGVIEPPSNEPFERYKIRL